MLKTKVKLYSLLVLLAVASVGMYWLRLPGNTSDEQDEHEVQIEIRFEPSIRPQRVKNDPYDPTVTIKAWIEGHLIINEAATLSPFFRPALLAKGQLLEVVASQQIGAEIQCLIKRPRAPSPLDQAIDAGQHAKVKCTHLEEG